MLTTSFLVALALTVFALGGVVFTGITARRSAHYALVGVMFATLFWAIWEAERIGANLTFPGAAGVLHTLHFVVVAMDTLLVPLVLWTGVKLARSDDPETRARHGRMARYFVVAIVITCILGTGMTLLAMPKDAVGSNDVPAAAIDG